MPATPAADALVQRLVIDRVAAPGMLNRHSAEHAHERFSRPASSHELGRLHRRVETASANSASLSLVRIDRSVEPGTASQPRPSNEVATAATLSGDVRSAPRAAAGDGPTSSFVSALVARQTPTITRTSELVARRVADVPGVIGSRQSVSRLMERSRASSGDSPPMASAVAAPTLVQRVAEPPDGGSASPVGASSPATAAATPLVVMRTASSTPAAQLAPHAIAASGSATSSPLARASVRTATRESAPLLWRQVDASAQAPVVSTLPAANASPRVSAASSTLVLRKADAPAAPSQPAMKAPSITTSPAPTGVVARRPTAPHVPRLGATPATGTLNLDWIAEQVGIRLARRLEIERERMGVRQWRQ